MEGCLSSMPLRVGHCSELGVIVTQYRGVMLLTSCSQGSFFGGRLKFVLYTLCSPFRRCFLGALTSGNCSLVWLVKYSVCNCSHIFSPTETAILNNVREPFTVRTDTDCDFYTLSKSDFLMLCQVRAIQIRHAVSRCLLSSLICLPMSVLAASCSRTYWSYSKP